MVEKIDEEIVNMVSKNILLKLTDFKTFIPYALVSSLFVDMDIQKIKIESIYNII